jgi:hypothetical protein
MPKAHAFVPNVVVHRLDVPIWKDLKALGGGSLESSVWGWV